MALADGELPFYPSKDKAVHFQVGGTQLGAIRTCKLDLKEAVVANKDDVIVCCRIEFVGSV